MENRETETSVDESFAEKCKKALENDLGFAVPALKSKDQKKESQDQKAVENVDILQKKDMVSCDRSNEVSSFSQQLESLSQELDGKTLETLDKIKKQKRLSTEEFQSLFDVIWKKGPDSRAVNLNSWFNET